MQSIDRYVLYLSSSVSSLSFNYFYLKNKIKIGFILEQLILTMFRYH